MTHTHTNTQVQRSVGTKDRMETKGRTDRQTDRQTDDTDCFTLLVDAVGSQVVTVMLATAQKRHMDLVQSYSPGGDHTSSPLSRIVSWDRCVTRE